jgi:hypothetical protein
MGLTAKPGTHIHCLKDLVRLCLALRTAKGMSAVPVETHMGAGCRPADCLPLSRQAHLSSSEIDATTLWRPGTPFSRHGTITPFH